MNLTLYSLLLARALGPFSCTKGKVERLLIAEKAKKLSKEKKTAGSQLKQEDQPLFSTKAEGRVKHSDRKAKCKQLPLLGRWCKHQSSNLSEKKRF